MSYLFVLFKRQNVKKELTASYLAALICSSNAGQENKSIKRKNRIFLWNLTGLNHHLTLQFPSAELSLLLSLAELWFWRECWILQQQ